MANGLRFPSNGDSPAAFVALQFTGANLLPIYPATYIWRLFPRQHTSYYTTFFWGNNGSFLWDEGAPNTYYGPHPYPDGGAGGTTHKWEISVEGTDYVVDDNANDTTVVKGQWYTQALVVRNTGSGKEHKFYWDLATSSNRVITWTAASTYGSTNPPSPALTFGDAPWSPQNERMSGTISHPKIFDSNLSLTAIEAEAASMATIASAEGVANRWWFKPTFSSVDDLTDPVTGVTPAWANSNKATLEDVGGPDPQIGPVRMGDRFFMLP